MLRVISEKLVVGLNLLIIAALVYFAARSANDLVAMWGTAPASSNAAVTATAPSSPEGLARTDYDPIVERDVFNSVKESAADQAEPVVATDLHLKLIGTSHLTMTQPFAIIEDQRNSRQDLYKLGNQIADAGKLVAVQKTRVLIDHAGQIVALDIPKDMASAPPDNDTSARSRSARFAPKEGRLRRPHKSREERRAERLTYQRELEASRGDRETRRAARRNALAARKAARARPADAPPEVPQQAPIPEAAPQQAPMPEAAPLDEAS